MSKNKKKTTITIVGILVLVIAVVGTSYAIWNYVYNGTLKNTLETADISLEFLESNTNIITVENALPMGCTEGKQQEETFDFAVTSTTTKDTKINYTISIQKLEVDNGYTALQDNQIALYLTDYTETNELLSGNYFSYPGCSAPKTGYCWTSKIGSANACYDTLQECQNDTSRGSDSCFVSNFPGGVEGVSLVSQLDNYKLYSGTHVHNSTHNKVQDKFKLRAWIAPDVDASSWNASTKLQYKFKIGLTSEEKEKGVYPEYVYRYGTNSVSIGTTLYPITGTKYVITDGNQEAPVGPYETQNECQTALEGFGSPAGYSCQEKTGTFGGFDYTEDYTTLNKTYFLKHNISSEGTVESSEVCYILNSTLYCLKGGDGGTAYSENTNILKTSFGESNCSVDSNNVSCSASNLGAGAHQNGSLGAGGGSSSCGVNSDGNSGCSE